MPAELALIDSQEFSLHRTRERDGMPPNRQVIQTHGSRYFKTHVGFSESSWSATHLMGGTVIESGNHGERLNAAK
jgi:hypothetical protein